MAIRRGLSVKGAGYQWHERAFNNELTENEPLATYVYCVIQLIPILSRVVTQKPLTWWGQSTSFIFVARTCQE